MSVEAKVDVDLSLEDKKDESIPDLISKKLKKLKEFLEGQKKTKENLKS